MANRITVSILGSSSLQGCGSDAQANRQLMREAWAARFQRVAPEKPDVILLPEFCSSIVVPTGGGCASFDTLSDDKLIPFFQEQAAQLKSYLSFTLPHIDPQGRLRNTMFMVDRTGTIIGQYHKAHPPESELKRGIVPGSPKIITTEFGQVACGICFDLNFDAMWEQYAASKPDLILFASVYHGGLMQAYRAYQCRCHLVSAIGGYPFKPSHVILPNGHIATSTTHYFDSVTSTINLDCRLVHLDYHWEKLQAMKNDLGRQIQIMDVDFLGSVLVTNESQDRTIDQILDHYEIIDLDRYFARATKAQSDLRAD